MTTTADPARGEPTSREGGDGPGQGSPAPDPLLSVIVVTYNEAERVGACLESIAAACEDVPRYEVIVVDSNSADGTVDVASEYDVTVVQITDDEFTTPGAGRYVGRGQASGDYLLYVDGDVVLEDGWVRSAIETVRTTPGLAGVDGFLDDCSAETPVPAEYLHGVALYDRAAIEDVGGFHPFLAAWEDVDLGFELRIAGYELRRLPLVTGSHPVATSPFEQLRRWRRGYYAAGGQVTRKALSEPSLLARWLGHFADKFLALGWLLAGIATLLVQPLLALGWLSATGVGVAALCARMGTTNGLQRSLSFLLFPAGFVLGFRRLPDRDAFPDDVVETVQQSEPTPVVVASSDRSWNERSPPGGFGGSS